MDPIDLIKMYFAMFIVWLPTLIVCLVAGILILVKWKQLGGAAIWALLGFGFTLILCFLLPGINVALQRSIYVWGYSPSIMIFNGIISSLLHATAYTLLLVAVLTGRTSKRAATAAQPRHTAI